MPENAKFLKYEAKLPSKRIMVKPVKKQNFQYPVKTNGAMYARELRERSNNMTDAQRLDSAKRALERIYAAPEAAAVGPRH